MIERYRVRVPAGAAEYFSSPGLTFCAESYFGIRTTLELLKATIIKVLFAEMYVNVVFVIRCLYSAVSLTLVKE